VWKRRIPAENGNKHTAILVLCGLSFVSYLLSRNIPPSAPHIEDMLRASESMAQATNALRQCRDDRGLPLNSESDPNLTGLVGTELSPITTTRGYLEAKRTTTNSNFAGLLVHLMREAGVQEGDRVAVGASGSFPALIVATLSAAKAINARALPIYSVGASQWGANEELFTWLDMERCLRKAGWLEIDPVAVSLGGGADIGTDWSPELQSSLESMVTGRGIRLLHESDLRTNVETRMKLYFDAAEGGAIRAFVNIGGAWANLGESPDILKLSPGLADVGALPPAHQRGVIYEMADRDVPVIHLLYVKGLVERYGLPWDPIPLPAPGHGAFYEIGRYRNPSFLVLAVIYLFLTSLTLAYRRRCV
jgi:poly-gamma-glutamate system protein